MGTAEKPPKNIIPTKLEGLDAALYYQRKIHLIQALDPYSTQKQEMGDLYCQLAAIEEAPENYGKAITIYERALEDYPFADFPVEHTTLQMRRGWAYFKLAKAELRRMDAKAPDLQPTTHLDQAIEAYQTASRIYTQTTYPLRYTELQHQIGRCHHLLMKLEDPHYHATKALISFTASLGVGKKKSQPTQYASNQYYIGLVHKEIARKSQQENDWKESLHSFQEALTVFSPEKKTGMYILTQLHMTEIYRKLAKVEEPVKRLQLAIQCYLNVLPIIASVRKAKYITARILTQIGRLYHKLGVIEASTENWQQALRVYHKALRMISRNTHPDDYGTIHLCIGKTYKTMAEIRDSTIYYTHAKHAFNEALTVFNKEEDPEVYRRIKVALKNLPC